jgi:hypothetical protein
VLDYKIIYIFLTPVGYQEFITIRGKYKVHYKRNVKSLKEICRWSISRYYFRGFNIATFPKAACISGIHCTVAGTVDTRVTTHLTYDQLGLRPKFLFLITTKSRLTTRASASVASTYPISRAVHCERSRCLLCFAGATMPIPLIKVGYVQYKQISRYRKRVCIAHGTFCINQALRPALRS